MYWYNNLGWRLNSCLLLVLTTAFVSCTKPNLKEAKGDLKYFDLKGFMHTDSAKLAAADPLITKTVNHNGETETRKLKIANWGNELSLFNGSDINKPSWRDSYDIVVSGDTSVYKAKTPDLKTQRLTIARVNGKITAVKVFNHTKNMLYETSEQLNYFPDSLYSIDKKQHVLLLGNNRYVVTGSFVK